MELQTERLAIFQLLRSVSDDDMTSGAGWESVLNKIFVSFIIMKKTGKVRCTVLVFCWQKLSKVNNFQLCLFVDENLYQFISSSSYLQEPPFAKFPLQINAQSWTSRQEPLEPPSQLCTYWSGQYCTLAKIPIYYFAVFLCLVVKL